MTNVPNEIRNIWTELYRFFDRNYLMENTETEWIRFWTEAKEISYKFPKELPVWIATEFIAEMIGERMKKEMGCKKDGKERETVSDHTA